MITCLLWWYVHATMGRWFSFGWLIIMTIWCITFSLFSMHFIVACWILFNYCIDVTVCVCHAELKSYLLTYLLNIVDRRRKSQEEVGVVTEDDDDGWREDDECWRVGSPRGHVDVSGTVWTDVAGVTVTDIAVFQVTTHSVSTQRHSELDTLVDVLTEVVGRCTVSYKPPTGRTPGQW